MSYFTRHYRLQMLKEKYRDKFWDGIFTVGMILGMMAWLYFLFTWLGTKIIALAKLTSNVWR